MKSFTLKFVGFASFLVLLQIAALGGPFAEKIPFTQPDGTPIVLWGQGDEFYAVFETLDGYTVIFNQQTKAYDYATLSADGDQLISTGVAVGQGNPSDLGLAPHVRISPKAIRKTAAERFARWDQVMEVTRRWEELKAGRQSAALSPAPDGTELSPPSATTTGQKLGLTLLIDFSDAVGTIPQAEILNYCNGDNYTSYGNNGSVKKYFLDNSNNQLTYSNVVTIYIRVPQPKTYYNNTANDCGDQGRLLIVDAVNAMKALTNYTTAILPTFSNLTVDGSSRVVAFNVFFAGGNSGVWSYGLWPHSWSLASSIDLGNGKKVYKYQITNIGTSLALGTFCHENGHMLCGFPDIYDYDYDSSGGAGKFCLMNSGGSGGNPSQVCAYLKRAAGWATTVALTSNSVLTASVSSSGTNFNRFYRYAKPGVSTEYFLIENRQKSGRDANLPAAGIAIWHIDELGDRDNQSTNFNTSHLNYEASLMQADNLWHFQNDANSGDSKDLYYLGNTAAGYANRFSDTTSPSARWWDGTASGIQFHHFSASGTTMTFGVGPEGPVIVMDGATLATETCLPANGGIDPNEMVVVNFALKNAGGRNTTNLVATLLATNGVALPSGPQTYGVVATNDAAVSRAFGFTASGTCGGTLTAVLQLQDGPNNLGIITHSFTLGAPGGSLVATDYSSGGLAVAIPDNTTVEVPLSITDVGTVADVNVRVRLNHTYDGDLVLSLVHPDGTVVALANNRGSAGDNFGSGAADCSGAFTVFDDAASTAIGSGSAPFAGSYSPEQLLSTLNGKAMTGTWKLRVADTAGSDTGTIYCFQLNVSRQVYACCDPSADLAVAVAASPNPVAGGQELTYTLSVTNLGPGIAFSVTLTDTLPANATFVSASPGCDYLGDRVVATVGALASGAASNFTVVVIPSAGGLITNTLTVAALTLDSNAANNSATDVTAVNTPPIITVQPNSQTAIAGTNVTFQVTALGTAPLAYQWHFNGTNLAEAAAAALTLTNVQVAQAGTYTVLITNEFGSVLSTDAVLAVQDPFIVTQPQDQAVAAGVAASFTVIAGGTLPLSYQWRKEGADLVDGANITGAQTPSLTVSNAQSGDTGHYSVIVSNLNGWVASPTAALTVTYPPVILTQPASQTVMAGSTVMLTVDATGSDLTFAWQRAGTNLVDGGKLSGATTASLTLSNVQAAEMGAYSVTLSNSYSSLVSSNALLALWPLVGWGQNVHTQADIPPGLASAAGFAGGLYHSLVLNTDGTVVAWGAGATNSGVSPHYGQARVPDGLADVVRLAGGLYHSLALKVDGTVVAWGAGTNDTGLSRDYGQALVPTTATGVAAIAAGGYHNLALKANGTVVAWGAGTNTGSSPHFGQAAVPDGLSNVVAIAAGVYHSLALKADGTLVAWGAGTNYTGSTPNFGQSQVPAGLSDVVAIACGGYHSLALKADGTVTAWGAGTNDTGSSPDFGQAHVPSGVTDVAALGAGLYHTLALKADGTVVAWGLNNNGQTNTPGLLANGVALAGGGYHTLALEGDGSPYFTVQPFNRTVTAGTTVKLAAMVSGLQPVTYQWQFDGTNLTGATANTLTLTNVQCSDAGGYTLLATNSLGSAASSAVALAIASTMPPTIICPADVTVAADAGSCVATGVALGTPLTDAPCGITIVTNNAPASYPLGTNFVTWMIMDAGGNTNSCQQRVIVRDDQAPTIVWYQTNVMLAAGSNCQAFMPDIAGTNYLVAVDNCSSVMVTQSVAPDAVLALGTTEVVLGAFDTDGNVAYVTNYVVVVDQTPPSITCPADLTVSADAGTCAATNVALGSPVTDDNCGVAAVTNNALAVYAVGTNVVTWTVTDASGNTNSGQQRVIVLDSQPPTIAWYRTNVVVVAGTNCQAFMPDITDTNYFLATDDCSPVVVTQSVAANTVLAAGTNEVVLGAFDLSGNAVYCTNYVVVVAPPVILSGPADQTVPLGQEVTFCLSATNDCGGELTYQWRFQGVEMAGATSNCCTFTVLHLTNAGSYDVVVANLAAAVTSPAAVLTVVGPYLTVQPVEPPSAGGGRTNFMFTFPSVAGVDYIVQYQDALQDTNEWLALVTNSGTGGLITNDFPITADSPSRFYRILLP